MMSLVLDTSVIFLHLGVLSFFFMSRSFLWTLVENNLLEANILTYAAASLLTALYCLSLLSTTYVMTSLKLIKFSKKNLVLALISVVSVSFLSLYANTSHSLNLDELFEGFTALVALGILAKNWKEAEEKRDYTETKKLGILDNKTFKVKKIFLFVLISIYAAANLTDFWRVSQSEVKSVGHWAHVLFQPLLICLGLIQVGFVSRQIKEAADLMFEKARQDKEIEEGRSYQLSMLPSLRRQTKHFEWRAWYKPASRLAGDWLDVRELEFLGGEKFLAAVVCDVTGHGTGSALTTSVLSSHWSLWCEELRYQPAPKTPSERGDLVAQALSRLDKGIASGQVHGMATAVCVLIDAARAQGSLCSCAHPPVYKFSSSSIDNLRCKGNGFVGEPHTRTGFEVSTFDFVPGETLCLYTDGLFFERGKSASGFVRQNLQKTPINISVQFLKQMRRARAFNRENRDFEDDITLMFVSYAKQNDSTTIRSAS
jgi:serine phosphatase RsbU (regulator of sigma subunit)